MSNVIKPTELVAEFLKATPMFSAYFTDNRNYSDIVLCNTLEEASAQYNSYNVMDFSGTEKSYWNNNSEGQLAELRTLEELPVSLIEEMNACENKEEIADAFMYGDPFHTYSRRIESKYSYLSDDWSDEESGFVIKEGKANGATYGTRIDNEAMVLISALFR